MEYLQENLNFIDNQFNLKKPFLVSYVSALNCSYVSFTDDYSYIFW